MNAFGGNKAAPPRHCKELRSTGIYRLHPLSERRLRRRGILQRHHFGHGAGLELDELINHC